MQPSPQLQIPSSEQDHDSTYEKVAAPVEKVNIIWLVNPAKKDVACHPSSSLTCASCDH